MRVVTLVLFGAFIAHLACAETIVTGSTMAGSCFQPSPAACSFSYNTDRLGLATESASAAYTLMGSSLIVDVSAFVSQNFFLVPLDSNASANLKVTLTQMLVLHSTVLPAPGTPVFANFTGAGGDSDSTFNFNFFSLAGQQAARLSGTRQLIFAQSAIPFDVPIQLVLEANAQCEQVAFTCRDVSTIAFNGFTDFNGRPLSFDVVGATPEPSSLALSVFGLAIVAARVYRRRRQQ